MQRLYISLLAVALMGSAWGCDDDNPTGPSDIVGSTWSLVSVQETGGDPIVINDPSKYTLRLEEGGQVAVRSDCNSCGGSYTLTGSQLELGPIACTKVACGEGSLDPAYARALEGSQTVLVDGSQMTIMGAGVTLQFRR